MRTAQTLQVNPGVRCETRTKHPRITLAERFWRHVDKTGECWVWTAGRNAKGYGTFRVERGRSALAHRVAWSMTNGEIPSGMIVRHSNECVARACVRPDHLRLGNQLENMADRRVSGRSWFRRVAVGVQRYNAKLNDWAVAEIRRDWASGISAASIARARGLAPQTVDKIVACKVWRHVG